MPKQNEMAILITYVAVQAQTSILPKLAYLSATHTHTVICTPSLQPPLSLTHSL